MIVAADDMAWFAVRCLFRSPDEHRDGVGAYEERITVWRVPSFEEAIARAEAEADEYVELLVEMGIERCDLCQVFKLGIDGAIGDGDEVYSLIRDSDLAPDDYIDHFFDSGTEYLGTLP